MDSILLLVKLQLIINKLFLILWKKSDLRNKYEIRYDFPLDFGVFANVEEEGFHNGLRIHISRSRFCKHPLRPQNI